MEPPVAFDDVHTEYDIKEDVSNGFYEDNGDIAECLGFIDGGGVEGSLGFHGDDDYSDGGVDMTGSLNDEDHCFIKETTVNASDRLGDEDTANMFGDEDYFNDFIDETSAGEWVTPVEQSLLTQEDYSSPQEISLHDFTRKHVAQVASSEVPKVIIPEDTRRKNPILDKFVRLHVAHAASSSVKVFDLPHDYTPEQVEHAFRTGRKEHLLNLLEYGIDIFAPMCIGSPEGKENWLLDFYGTNEPIARDLLMADKDIVLKAYRKQKWKISLVGGSVAHWNRRRHFVAFLERYVINMKNKELRERAKDIFAIVLVQSAIMSYL